MNVQIPAGKLAQMTVFAKDASGNALPFGSLTATIDNAAVAYVAVQGIAPDHSNALLDIVPKAPLPAPGTAVTVTVTCSGTSQIGNPLPPLVQSFDIQGPPPPPQATAITDTTSVRDTLFTFPVDPGTATITVI